MIDPAGVDARIRILPALGSPSPQLKPLAQRGRGTVDLDAGYWQLAAQPLKKGIVTLAIHAEGEKPPAPSAPQGGVLFPSVPLSDRHGYDLVVGTRPRVVSGLVLRPLPMDLTDPLPVAARPGQTVSVPFEAAEERTPRRRDRGRRRARDLGGRRAGDAPRRASRQGRHEVKVTLGGRCAARPLDRGAPAHAREGRPAPAAAGRRPRGAPEVPGAPRGGGAGARPRAGGDARPTA